MKKFIFAAALCLAVSIMASAPHAVFAEETGYDKALTHYRSGNYKEAVSYLESYVQNRPEPAAYYLMGYALYHLGRHDEATRYFNDAYLINPEFSPKPLLEALGKTAKEVRPKAVVKPEALVKPEAAVRKPAVKKALPAPLVQEKPKAPKSITEKPAVRELAPQVAPEPEKELPPQTAAKALKFSPVVLIGFFAGLGLIVLLVSAAFYIYFSLCLFLIAKKSNVSAAWTAWVPFVQIWAFVASAGKPWWWILILLVPVVNLFAAVYLWMLITENLGRNKWLGLIMLLPVINLGFLGLLAFSKTEGAGGYAPGTSEFPEEPGVGGMDFMGEDTGFSGEPKAKDAGTTEEFGGDFPDFPEFPKEEKGKED
ncbi:MAG: tetratricopeptide repeat protein [Thermodesulfovibrionales bacterium]|nr:tetratricopeptide repeat protein [Thermodesulfovibrionales bacterium]